MPNARILVVDDEPDIRELVSDILDDEGYQVTTAENGETAKQAYRSVDADLILLDIWMPDIDGISLLAEWGELGPLKCPVVILSGHGTVETAVEATRLGAFDFIEKPLSMAKLLLTVNKALEQAAMPKAKRGADSNQSAPIGTSLVMQDTRRRAEQAAQHGANILITGEAGSGRETLARYVHARSGRRDHSFVVMNASQLQEERLREQLCGQAADDGSYQPGLLAEAGEGTLYISDVAALSRATQSLLAQILEAGHYQAAGQDEDRPVSARIIAACSTSPDRLVSSGDLNEDLYFRLNVLPLTSPPLRDHAEDIPDLVRHFADFFPVQEDLPYRSFPVAVQNRLRNHPWPGNIKQLKNVIQRLLILGDGNEVSMTEVEEALDESAEEVGTIAGEYPEAFNLPLREAREHFEREYLIFQLKRAEGSVGKLAEVVGMERTHLYRKLRALEIDPKQVIKE